MPELSGVTMGVNYGLDRVRWVTPVGVNERFRAGVTVQEVRDVEGGVENKLLVDVRVEGKEEKPAMVAVWITRLYGDG